jgi:hypothetical protein
VLRSPVGSILSRFRVGGLRLKLVWYGFMLTAVLLMWQSLVAARAEGLCRLGCRGDHRRRDRCGVRFHH